ncbi:TRAP transporter large permease [Oricola thermophila]|uniref:TRAP transporter large permease protein n=1 Tax=Oricola thermophila TaxID=2742145 RepID=A0A6N1VEP6_9HYPH|nr:TRAP transporter large permease [Oricola thermophila]QKV18993.1 TRAP transporter large permease [Oricola thermophila]
MVVTFSSFLLLILFGAPIVFALGVSATVALAFTTDTPLAIVAQRVFAGLDSFPIMAIPFFVLAGLIMETGGIARRIVSLAQALIGWIPGSLYGVSTVTGTGLSAISGSGTADTAAIASMMIPEMRRRGYDIDLATSLIAAAGSLAPIIPPSVFMIVVATISNLSVGRLFLAGIVPGLVISIGLLLCGYIVARRGGERYRDNERFTLSAFLSALVAAIPALLLPIIIVGGIVGGVFTPTEAAAVAVVVGLAVSVLIYRELSLKELPGLILRTAGLSAVVMMVIATASIFSWLIASQNVPGLLGGWISHVTDSRVVFLLIVNVLLLFVGMFLESISAIVILVPMLMPIALSFGIDPTHFGVVVCLNLAVGMITPPYGICLFVASSVAERPIQSVARRVWIPLVPMMGTLLAITFIPEIVLALPNAVMGGN